MSLPLRGTAKSGGALNGANITLTFDTGAGAPLQGDVVVLFGGHANSSDANTFGPVTTGYTQVAVIDSTGPKFGVWYKVMGATPDLTVVGDGGGNAQHGSAYACYVLDGTLIDPVIFDATATSTGQLTGVPNCQDITTVTNNAWVIGHYGNSLLDTTKGTVAGYTDLVSVDSGNDTDDIAIAAVYKQVATAGFENPGAWSAWSSGTGGGITVAIRPASVHFHASGSPVATLSKTASGTAAQIFNASGAPVATLSKTASGTAAQIFNASGAPVATLSKTASGTAAQIFNASGAPVATLSKTASGTAAQIFNASGAPVATLSPFSSGTASEMFNASGAPVATLSKTASGTASEIFNASGAPVAALSATAAGSGTMTPDAGGPTPVTGSGAPVATLSAFASGTARMTPPGGAPRRKARGYIVYDEPPAIKKKTKRKPVVEADPLPEIIGIPAVELEHLSRARWAEVLAVPLTPKRARPARPAPVEVDEDEEDFDDLLEVLSMID